MYTCDQDVNLRHDGEDGERRRSKRSSSSRRRHIEHATKKSRPLAPKNEKRMSGKKRKRDGMRHRWVKSLIYAPDKEMRNSIRPPKSASSIFVVRNVTAAAPRQDGARTSGARAEEFPVGYFVI